MKKVFSKSVKVAHAWANQTQDEARVSSGNFRFDGKKVYSYSMEIACLRETPSGRTVVFVDRSSHSHTTTGHQSDALVASNQYPQFTFNSDAQYAEVKWGTSDANYLLSNPSGVEPLAIWEQYHSLRTEVAATAKEKRFVRTRTQRLAEAQSFADKANHLKDLFELDVPTLSAELTAEESIEMAAHIETKRLVAVAERKRLADTLKTEREEWLAGTRSHFPRAKDQDICLRLNPRDTDEVQTSQGATVPTKVCRRLFKAFKDQQMPDDQSVGNFQLKEVSKEGLTIGCHHIKADELVRFSQVLWPDILRRGLIQ